MNVIEATLIVCVSVVAIVAAITGSRLRRERVQASFDALTFQTPAGSQPGHRMRVVKQVIDTTGASEGGDGVNGAFWYCVGPGPSYFVAIATPGRWRWPRAELKWVVRPLSAERMRGALASDREALLAAFGDVIGDKLHA